MACCHHPHHLLRSPQRELIGDRRRCSLEGRRRRLNYLDLSDCHGGRRLGFRRRRYQRRPRSLLGRLLGSRTGRHDRGHRVVGQRQRGLSGRRAVSINATGERLSAGDACAHHQLASSLRLLFACLRCRARRVHRHRRLPHGVRERGDDGACVSIGRRLDRSRFVGTRRHRCCRCRLRRNGRGTRGLMQHLDDRHRPRLRLVANVDPFLLAGRLCCRLCRRLSDRTHLGRRPHRPRSLNRRRLSGRLGKLCLRLRLLGLCRSLRRGWLCCRNERRRRCVRRH